MVSCAWCGGMSCKPTGEVNRAATRHAPLYCDKACSGLARRKHKTADQCKSEKAEYDRQRRSALRERLRIEKQAAYRAMVAADPDGVRARERAYRQTRKAAHAEYCRRPEYRDWKQGYDRKYRAQKDFGPFAEAALLLHDLENEIGSRSTFTERAHEKGTINKTQRRKREYEQAVGC
jgi:hypothetical protein